MGKSSQDSGPHADIAFTPATELVKKLKKGKLSASDLAQMFLDRIRTIDDSPNFDGQPGLQSVLAINSLWSQQAERRDLARGKNGSLAGLPILIKDNIEAIGLPATAGSLALAGREVQRNSDIVEQVTSSGATILGSTNLSEWANIRSSNSTSGWSAIGGLTANPWKFAHSAGGSSSGSGAAVAAGLIPAAIGTETDGSIVCPASLNGCVGIKPTVGATSTRGIVPVSSTQDSPGPLARSVADAALLLDAMSGLNSSDHLSNRDSLSVAIVNQWITLDDQTNELLEQIAKNLRTNGITVTQVDVAKPSDQEYDDEIVVMLHDLVDDLDEYLAQRPGNGVHSLAEVVAFNIQEKDLELAHFDQSLFEQALASGGRNAKFRSARARNLEWALTKVLGPALHGVDVAIGATYAPAWLSKLGGGDDYSTASSITMAPAIAGWPIGCLPMGLVDGLPVGLGVVARAHDEVGLVRAMSQIERSIGLGVLKPTFQR